MRRRAFECVFVCLCMCVYVYVCMFMCVYLCVCVYVYVCVCVMLLDRCLLLAAFSPARGAPASSHRPGLASPRPPFLYHRPRHGERIFCPPRGQPRFLCLQPGPCCSLPRSIARCRGRAVCGATLQPAVQQVLYCTVYPASTCPLAMPQPLAANASHRLRLWPPPPSPFPAFSRPPARCRQTPTATRPPTT